MKIFNNLAEIVRGDMVMLFLINIFHFCSLNYHTMGGISYGVVRQNERTSIS